MLKKALAAVLLLSSTLASVRLANATENGQITYPVGVNTVLNGILPAPGQTQFYNYTQFYDANRFNGANGDKLIPGFKVQAFVDAPRILHTWSAMLGPFTMTSGVIVPLAHVSVDVPGASGTKNGLGDIILQPLFIGYSNPTHTFFAFAAPFDVGIPTGSYSKTRVANTGANYYAFLPSFNVTWFPAPKWELSATALLAINTRNKDTNYQSGSVAVLDYGIGYTFAKDWQAGIQGFFLRQISDDKLNGETFQDGFRGRAVGIGPQLRYDFMPGGGIAFKYQREFDVRNRPQGNRFWIQLCFPI